MERDAKYVAVALFTLLAVAAAFAFVWWYSGRGDQRTYENYEVYFEGSVSGLSRGSPVRYLGVDVGRVHNLRVDANNPGRVKVVAEIDSTAPITGATRARLGLLGLTGLLFIDLQVDPEADPGQPLETGESYPMILAGKGDIEAFLERLPDLVGDVGAVVERIERVLADENIEAVRGTLQGLEEGARALPQLTREATVMMGDLRRISTETEQLISQTSGLVSASSPALVESLNSIRVAADRAAAASQGIERIVSSAEAPMKDLSSSGLAELRQLLVDLRVASDEVSGLARELRENPSRLLREPAETGVEIAP
jgi:phospholipid/cholesterol/gamma-HCH transport system substrate-binding protein